MNYYESTLKKEDLRRCASGVRCVHEAIGPILLLEAFTGDNDYCNACLTDRSTRRRINWQHRQARLRQLPNTFTPQQWEQCKQYFQNKCVFCGESWSGVEPNFFIGLSNEHCPGKVVSNIVPSCKSCAMSRRDMDVKAWFWHKHRLSDVGIEQRLAPVYAYFESVSGN